VVDSIRMLKQHRRTHYHTAREHKEHRHPAEIIDEVEEQSHLTCRLFLAYVRIDVSEDDKLFVFRPNGFEQPLPSEPDRIPTKVTRCQ